MKISICINFRYKQYPQLDIKSNESKVEKKDED